MENSLSINNGIDLAYVDSSNSSGFFAKIFLLCGLVGSSFALNKASDVQKDRLLRIVEEKTILASTLNNIVSSDVPELRSDKSADVFNYFEDTYCKCASLLPFEERITIESPNYLRQFLQLEKKARPSQYGFLLQYLAYKNDLEVLKAILVSISSFEYYDIIPEEEMIISLGLHSFDIVTQEIALNALLSIDHYSNKDALKDVLIGNRFLQRDLDEFLKV